jgi:hypothetical protein
LEAINPSYRLYGICVKCKGVAKSAIQDVYYEVPKIYVFLTYFPFVNFFLNALYLIVGNPNVIQTLSVQNNWIVFLTCQVHKIISL